MAVNLKIEGRVGVATAADQHLDFARLALDGVIQREYPRLSENPRFSELLRPTEKINYPTMLLLNTRVWLNEYKRLLVQAGELRPEESFTLDKVPDVVWQDLRKEYDTIWFMGIYEPSAFSQNHAKKYAEKEYKPAIPNLNIDTDVVASPFAIGSFNPSEDIIEGGWEGWQNFYQKLHNEPLGFTVMVDFIPNHVGVDHPWAKLHPDYFIQATQEQYAGFNEETKEGFVAIEDMHGVTHYIAHGKDPNYPSWTDTLQLDYTNPDLQAAMIEVLLRLVENSDGVRGDMVMLENFDTKMSTWGWLLKDNLDPVVQERKHRWYIFAAIERIQRHMRNNEYNKISDEEWGIWNSNDRPRYQEEMAREAFWAKASASAHNRADELGKTFFLLGETYWDKDILGAVFDGLYGKEIYDGLMYILRGHHRQEISADKFADGQEHENKFYECVDNVRVQIASLLGRGSDARPVVFGENHDESRLIHEQSYYFISPHLPENERWATDESRGVPGAMIFMATLGLLPQMVMVHQGQREGRVNRIPAQVKVYPSPEYEMPNMRTEQFMQDFLELRRSHLFQDGMWTMARIGSSDYTNNTDQTFRGVIGKQVDISGEGGAIFLHDTHEHNPLNSGENSTSCHVYLPEDVDPASLAVYDLNTHSWVSPIAKINRNGLFIRFDRDRFDNQIIFYTKLQGSQVGHPRIAA